MSTFRHLEAASTVEKPTKASPAAAQLPEPDGRAFEESRTRLARRFQEHPLRYGYIQYPPFVEVTNGKPSGAAVECIEGIATDLELQPDPEGREVEWADIETRLANDLDIVIAPVIYGRRVGLFAFCEFQSLLLVYRNEYAGDVEDVFAKIAELIGHGQMHSLAEWERARSQLKRLCNCGSGFGVTRGTIVAQLIQQYFYLDAFEFAETDITKNLRTGLAKEPSYLMAVDEPSWERIKTSIGLQCDSTRFFSKDASGGWLPAGFATRENDRDLLTFLKGESLYSSHGRVARFIDDVRNQHVEDWGIKLVDDVQHCIQIPLPNPWIESFQILGATRSEKIEPSLVGTEMDKGLGPASLKGVRAITSKPADGNTKEADGGNVSKRKPLASELARKSPSLIVATISMFIAMISSIVVFGIKGEVSNYMILGALFMVALIGPTIILVRVQRGSSEVAALKNVLEEAFFAALDESLLKPEVRRE